MLLYVIRLYFESSMIVEYPIYKSTKTVRETPTLMSDEKERQGKDLFFCSRQNKREGKRLQSPLHPPIPVVVCRNVIYLSC